MIAAGMLAWSGYTIFVPQRVSRWLPCVAIYLAEYDSCRCVYVRGWGLAVVSFTLGWS